MSSSGILYPESLEKKIGFDTIRSILIENCQFVEGKSYVKHMQFSHDFKDINRRLEQTHEMLQFIELGIVLVPKGIDSRALLNDVKAEGTFLEAEDILDIIEALFSAIEITHVINNQTQDFKQLKALGSMVYFDSNIPRRIKEKFDSRGYLKDSASAVLKRVRMDKKKAQNQIRKSLNNVFAEAKVAGIVPENSNPTLRDGRFVIPIIASHKRRIKGFVHDESATGHTVFIEPADVLEENNTIIELGYAERREEIKILRNLSSLLRNDSGAIEEAFRFLGLIDFIVSKARLAQKLGAVKPLITVDIVIDLLNARHPILYLGHLNENSKIVPLDITLDINNRIFLISGPNAGGKSVCLKTVGLIQYMLQCGLLVPLHPDSRMCLFHDVFVDIGDEQSIENDLSTYSSHLENMRVFIAKAGRNSLVLIDEFGTGTDPQFGGAIAEAILEELLEKYCFGVITTHYGNLKEFAQGRVGIKNGAMQFDLKKLEPLYILDPDKPGSSFALEVARKIGLSEKVLKKARTIAGSGSVQVENLINKLSEEKRVLSDKLKTLVSREKHLQKSIHEYETLQRGLKDTTKSIIDRARTEASDILHQTNRRIEKTIRHIKENKAQKTETKKVREVLDKFKDSLKTGRRKKIINPHNEIVYLEGEMKKGDQVLVEESQLVGEVLEIKGKSARILIGNLQSHVKVKQLRKIKRYRQDIRRESQTKPFQNIDLIEKRKAFSSLFDIRGSRGIEVPGLIDQFIDDAILLGYRELKVLHGKGDGVLRKLVQEQLKLFPQIISVEDEHVDRGGAGITVIVLKN